MHVNEREILEAALLGYRAQVVQIQEKMREIVARLNPAESETEIVKLSISHRPQLRMAKPKRRFSAKSRAAMSAAAKKRWRLLKRAAA